MRSTVFSIAAILFLSLTSTAVFAKGSNLGIYAVVDQVTFDQRGPSPNAIRISGTFIVPLPMSSGSYTVPERGYLYFRSPPGKELAARTEWHKLKTAAGTGRIVAFASYWVPDPNDPGGHYALKVRVRKDGDVRPPDVYPVTHPDGVVKASDRNPHFDRIAAASLEESFHSNRRSSN